MITSLNSPLLTLAAFGISTVLLGGFIGSEIVKRRQMKEELLEIQKTHQETMKRMEATYQAALEFDRKTLQQLDSAYVTLIQFNTQESKVRNNVDNNRKWVDNQRNNISNLQKELSNAAMKSKLEFDE